MRPRWLQNIFSGSGKERKVRLRGETNNGGRDTKWKSIISMPSTIFNFTLQELDWKVQKRFNPVSVPA